MSFSHRRPDLTRPVTESEPAAILPGLFHCDAATHALKTGSFLVLAFSVSAISQVFSADDCDRGCIDRLQAQLTIYRRERERHEKWDFFQVSLNHAQQLETEGLQQLPSTADLVKAGKAGWDAGMGMLARKLVLTNAGETVVQTQERAKLLEKLFKAPGDIAQKGFDAGEAFIAIQSRSQLGSASALEQKISAYENWRKVAKGATAWDVTGRISPLNDMADLSVGFPLVKAYLERADRATTDTERLMYREKAGKEAIHMIQNAAKIGKSAITTELKLVEVNADVWSRIAYWAGAHYAANGERDRAIQVRNDAISALTYRILVTQYEIDQAQRKERIQAARTARAATREPGGIKISGVAADVLAAKMDLTGVGFDPVRGRLILTGHDSEQVIDLSIFADVMRLAMEKNDPFFSLNPVTPRDWDSRPQFVHNLLAEKYFRRSGDDAKFIARLRQVGTRLPLGSDRECYSAYLRDFDGAMYRELASQLDGRVERVYSPEWLAYSQVGRILFEADLAIKAVAAGLLEVEEDRAASVASVWKIPDFSPRWAMVGQRMLSAGRANFELDSSNVLENGGFLDLSEVKPKLVMVRRESGTSKDLPPDEVDNRVTAHFDAHWREYAAQIPAIAELVTVFRAYVAARYIIRQQRSGGLIQRILAMEPPAGAPGVPLYDVRSPTILACERSGTLAYVREGSRKVFDVSGGFGGGISMSTTGRNGIARITYSSTANPTAEGVFGHKVAVGSEDIVEEGGRRGLVFDLDTLQTVPVDRQLKLWMIVLAGAALLVVVGEYFRYRRGFFSATDTCPHCARVHRPLQVLGGLGDILAIGTLAFLVSLPFIAAVQEAKTLDFRLLVAIAAVCSLLAFVALPSWYAQEFVARRMGWSGYWGGFVKRMGTGARWFGLGLALVLFFNGVSESAVGDRYVFMFGRGIGERTLAYLGSAEILRWAAGALVAAATISAVTRWCLPFVFDSRPLPVGARQHSHGK